MRVLSAGPLEKAGLGASPPDQQRRVDDYFESSAGYWRDVYHQEDRLLGVIYRQRREVALKWISGLRLPKNSRVLEVGCGAGSATLALAQNGHIVHAVDSVGAMIEITRQEAGAAGLSERVILQVGDVHHLAFPVEQFDLVLAVGLLPWLHSESAAIAEMARVLKSGGFLLLSADNRIRLNSLADPRSTPLLSPVRQAIKRLFRWPASPHGGLQVKRHLPGEVDQMVAAAGLRKVNSATLGFGPFFLFGMPLLPDWADVFLHRALQWQADRKMPGLRMTGSHYLLLAQKTRQRGCRTETDPALSNFDRSVERC